MLVAKKEYARGIWDFSKTYFFKDAKKDDKTGDDGDLAFEGDCEEANQKVKDLGNTVSILEGQLANLDGSINYWSLEEKDCIGTGGLLREVECLLRQDIKAGDFAMTVIAAVIALPAMLAF